MMAMRWLGLSLVTQATLNPEAVCDPTGVEDWWLGTMSSKNHPLLVVTYTTGPGNQGVCCLTTGEAVPHFPPKTNVARGFRGRRARSRSRSFSGKRPGSPA
jgi:hypothetical protein